MKILFISNDPTIFDEGSSARARMHGYARVGELHVLSIAGPGAKKGQEGNLFLHPVSRIWKYVRVSVLAYLAHRIIRKHGIEVVSAQDPFEHGLAALRAIRGTKAKLHVQVHTDFLSAWFVRGGTAHSLQVHMPFLNRHRRIIADRVLPAAQGIRVVSERIQKSLIARYGNRIPEPVVIPIAVSTEVPPCVPLPKHPFTFTLMAIGRLEPEKRIEDILVALNLVVKKYPKTGLFIVGDGRERGVLERLVHTLKLERNVVFLGNREDAWGLMRDAHVFVQASAYEGYGRTLIEAALAQIPIVTTDVGIVGEVLKDHEDALVGPVADPTIMATHILKLIENNMLRREIAMRAEVEVRKHLQSIGEVSARIGADLVRAAQQS